MEKKIDRSKFKPTKGLVIARQMIRMEFRKLIEYIEETDRDIREKTKQLEEAIEVAISERPEERDDILDTSIDEYQKYSHDYVVILRHSAFITSYSLFENLFLRIAEYGRLEKNILLQPQDIKGDGIIGGCRKFIEKALLVDLSAFNDLWKEINQFKAIRNNIVHHGGNYRQSKDVPLDKQPLYAYIILSQYLQIKNSSIYFYISDCKYVTDFCDKAQKYLLAVIEKMLEEFKKPA